MTAKLYKLPQLKTPATSLILQTDENGLRKRIILGCLTAALLIFGIGGWALTAQLSGAIIAGGLVVVDSNTKKVQHPTGGVVGEIFVKNGSRVNAGDLLLRLDDTQTRSKLSIVVSQLTELTGRRARLKAESEYAQEILFPVGFETHTLEASRVAEGERRLFAARRAFISSQQAQIQERIGQYREEVEGLLTQRTAKARELKILRQEAERVANMHKRKLTTVTRLLAIQRDQIRIAGEHGELTSRIAQAKGRIAETRMQSITMERSARNDAQQELRDIEARIAELREHKIATEDQFKRVDIRAPKAGVVHELAVHTIGGVIDAAEPIMLIVPSGDRLAIEIRIPTSDIDQVALGQPAMLRFSAFNQRTTPQIPGKVTRLAADLSHDVQSGQRFYLARIKADETAMRKLKHLDLMPGMPVEAFIQTGNRTAISYITKPLSDHIARTFREE